MLRDKLFNIAKNTEYDGYQRGFVSMLYKFFDKNSAGGAVARTDKPAIKGEIMTNQRPLDLARRKLAEVLHKPITRKLKNKK